MSETESAHGKLAEVDQKFDGPRFMMLLVGTLVVAVSVIFLMASYKSGNFGWNPLSHEIVRHSLESSSF